MIADKIVEQLWDAPRILQHTFKEALLLEGGFQLVEAFILGHLFRSCRPPQMDQGSASSKDVMGVHIIYT